MFSQKQRNQKNIPHLTLNEVDEIYNELGYTDDENVVAENVISLPKHFRSRYVERKLRRRAAEYGVEYIDFLRAYGDDVNLLTQIEEDKIRESKEIIASCEALLRKMDEDGIEQISLF